MKILKLQIQVPTIQFGYILAEVEGTVQDAVEIHNDLKTAYNASQNAGEGLPKKEFDRCLDEFLKTGTLINGTELYAQMNVEQQGIFQTIKRSLKRINSKEE